MFSFKYFLRKPKDTPELKLTESNKNEERFSKHQENLCLENNSNESNLEETINQPFDYNCIASDFTDDMLAMEMMRLGYDPANMDKQQMIEILYTHMDSNKPTVEVDSVQV